MLLLQKHIFLYLPLQHETSNKLIILWIILIYSLFLVQLLYLLKHPSVLFLAQLYGWILNVLCGRLPTSQQAATHYHWHHSPGLWYPQFSPQRSVSTEEVIYSVFINIQSVHKVSLQFQKFITKANEKTDKWKLLQNETYLSFICLTISCHVRCSIPSSVAAMASVILCFRLVMSRTFVVYTISLTQPYRKKSSLCNKFLK
jgi:hypothetical protein